MKRDKRHGETGKPGKNRGEQGWKEDREERADSSRRMRGEGGGSVVYSLRSTASEQEAVSVADHRAGIRGCGPWCTGPPGGRIGNYVISSFTHHHHLRGAVSDPGHCVDACRFDRRALLQRPEGAPFRALRTSRRIPPSYLSATTAAFLISSAPCRTWAGASASWQRRS